MCSKTGSPANTALEQALKAASLYRATRRSGETARSMIDCLVAAVAVRLPAPVLAQDRDVEVLRQTCRLWLV